MGNSKQILKYFVIIMVVFGVLGVIGSFADEKNEEEEEHIQIESDGKGSRVGIDNFMGGSKKSVSGDFGGGEINNMMGSVQLDLSNATLASDQVLDVSLMMGAVKVIVPKDMRIDVGASAFLGGVEDKSEEGNPAEGPVLHIYGSIFMGGLNIDRN